jgi:hypothetical protein
MVAGSGSGMPPVPSAAIQLLDESMAAVQGRVTRAMDALKGPRSAKQRCALRQKAEDLRHDRPELV